MTQSAISQKYKLSVVSGGKPILPRFLDASSCKKNISCLTYDQQNYIVPFNNQIKIYSLETRQCIKTLKYANNLLLSTIFNNNEHLEDIVIIDILLGDITVNDVEKRQEDKFITIFTNLGQVIVLNYKGKLIDSPKFFQLNLETSENENVYKIFIDESTRTSIKALTTLNSKNSLFNYKLSDLKFPESKVSKESPQKVDLIKIKTIENIILSNWSNDETFMVVLYRDVNDNNHRHVLIQSIFDDSTVKDFALSSLLHTSQHTTNNTNASSSNQNSRFVASIAINNSASQLALGFASGVISITTLSDLQNRLLKWHIDSVLSLTFTNDGSYLLSGGWEKVLNFWQLSTNVQQFLPRLNGVIVDIQTVGKYYALALQMTENESNSDYHLVVLNSADLTSKLSITGPLPFFSSPIKDTIQPISMIKSNTQINISKKKQKRKLLKAKRQDFTTAIELNPQTKQLYIPHQSALQTFDFYKNEQVSFQYLTDGMSNSMGKVREELNIRDPEVQTIKVTQDGQWLISYEVEFPPDDLMSSKDLSHVLKFWVRSETDSSQWVLKTKVLNPHGVGVPVTKIIVAPKAVSNGIGCLTTDNNGGMKYWAFDTMEKNWCLKKLLMPNFINFSNSVSLAWSRDGSLIFHGFDDKLQILDFENFKRLEFENSDDDHVNTTGEFTLDSEIQAIKLIGETNLIVATKTSLNVIDLLMGKIVNGFDLYPYVDGIYKNGHLDRLIACDEKSEKLAIVINQRVDDDKDTNSIKYKSNIIIFNAGLTKKLDSFVHDEYISWIGWNPDTDFIFIDTQSRFGIVGTTVSTEMSDEVNREGILDGLAGNTNNLIANDEDLESSNNTGSNERSNNYLDQLRELSRKKNKLDIESIKESTNNEEDEDIEMEVISGSRKNGKSINMNSFTNMFENIQNIPMETLFDNVIKALT